MAYGGSVVTLETAPARAESSQASLYADVYPESWYAVAPSRSLRRGAARAVDAFGKAWVMLRTKSGEARLYDRFCPHMGASLACGHVQRDRIVCPFHGWEFAPEGAGARCARIPYMDSSSIPARARVGGLPVVDEPTFALPDLPEARDASYGVRELSQRFDVHPLLILENGCDAQHFKYVHDVDFVRYDVEMLHEASHAFAFRIDQEVRGLFARRFALRLTIQYAGASAIFGTLETNGDKVARFVAAPLPLGPKRTLFHLIVFTKRLPVWLRGLDPVYQWWFARRIFKGSTDDYLPIWRHMNPERRAVLVEEDRLQQRFRRYYRAHLPASGA
jgi:nitrite reductase/ring-hydroxylating ferredoxin subunit